MELWSHGEDPSKFFKVTKGEFTCRVCGGHEFGCLISVVPLRGHGNYVRGFVCRGCSVQFASVEMFSKTEIVAEWLKKDEEEL